MSIRTTLPRLAVILIGLIGMTGSAFAQGSAQVTIVGVPPILSSPYMADLIQDYEQGQFMAQFTYTSTNLAPVDFRFRVSLTQNGTVLAEEISEPTAYTPGVYIYRTFTEDPPIRFSVDFENLLANVTADLQRQIVQGGAFPEGQYQIDIEPIAEDFSVATLGGIAPFTIRFPQAPVLFSPPDESTVLIPTPVFSWTPVIAPPGIDIEYEVVITEVLPGQTPLQAFEGNRPHVIEQVINQTVFVYTPAQLPLETGREYAWGVKAGDPDNLLPITDEGQSTIQTFTFGSSGAIVPEDIANLLRINLQPQFAWLEDLGSLEVTEDGLTYVLNGNAKLRLEMPEPVVVDVLLQDLRIQKSGLDNPVVLGGSLTGNFAGDIMAGTNMEWINPRRLSWTFGQNFTADVDMNIPGQSPIEAEGQLILTPLGVEGSISATGDPIAVLGGDPVELTLTELTVRYPEGLSSADGFVRFFGERPKGENGPCKADRIAITDGGIFANVDCDVDEVHLLTTENAFLAMRLTHASGTVESDWNGSDVRYAIQADAEVTIDAEEDICASKVDVGFSSQEGFAVQGVLSTCTVLPPVNLGFAVAWIHDLQIPKLSYSEQDGWDFELSVDMEVVLPFGETDMDELLNPGPSDPGREEDLGLRLPELEDVILSKDGIRLPELRLEEADLGDLVFRMADFIVELSRFEMPEITLPWSDWLGVIEEGGNNEMIAGAWEFIMDFVLRLDSKEILEKVDKLRPVDGEEIANEGQEGGQETGDTGDPTDPGDQPGGEETAAEGEEGDSIFDIPECLRNASIEVTDATFGEGRLSASVPLQVISPACVVPFGKSVGLEMYALNVTELGGEFSGAVGVGGLQLDGGLEAKGSLTAGDPFTCGDDDSSNLGTTTLGLTGSGLFTGEIDNLVPPCPLEVGPYTAELTEGSASFEIGLKGQSAKMEGVAVVEYENDNDETLTATGVAKLDLIKADYDELNLEIEGPMKWGVPEESPVLTFMLDRAVLNPDGMLVEGQQEFLIGEDSTIAVTFDEVEVGFQEKNITSGRIVFADAFGFEVGINEQDPSAMVFETVAVGDTIRTNPGARFDLGGTVLIDSTGLNVSGSGQGKLAAGELHFPDMQANYEDGFRMGLNPFGVRVGQMDLIADDQRVAFMDAEGFHLEHGFFEPFLPDTMPLPTMEVAYLVLKKDGDFLVDYETLEGGTIRLDSKPGIPLDLVIPSIQGDLPEAPSLEVSLSDVRISGAVNQLSKGTIRAAVPEGDPQFDLQSRFGLPFTFNEVIVGAQEIGGMASNSFLMAGNLLLFEEEEIVARNPVYAAIGADLRISAAVDMDSLNQHVPFFEDTDLVGMRIHTLAGEFSLPVTQPQFGTFDLDITGTFEAGADSSLSLKTGMDASFSQNGFEVHSIAPDSGSTTGVIDYEAFTFNLDKLESLSIGWTKQAGWDFLANADFSIGFETDSAAFVVPLRGVQLSTTGLSIPEQESHEDSQPALRATPVMVQGVSLRPLALRIPEIQVSWANLDARSPLTFLPVFDFELKLPNLGEYAPDLAGQSFTLLDVGFQDGVITGALEEFTFPGDGARFLLGPAGNDPPVLFVKKISGGFSRNSGLSGPVQDVAINLEGSVGDLPMFNSDTECEKPSFALSLSRGVGLDGSITNFLPCGEMELGPFGLAMNGSEFRFEFTNDVQSAILDGSALLTLPAPSEDTTDLILEGDIELDVYTGAFLDGFIEIDQEFNWPIPSAKHNVFDLTVSTGRLDANGLLLSGDGEIDLDGGASVTAGVNDLLLGFEDFAIQSGSVVIDAQLGLQTKFTSPIVWETVAPNSAFDGENLLRMNTSGQITIDASGILIDGESTAQLTVGSGSDRQMWPELRAEYNQFQLGFGFGQEATNPLPVQSGRAELFGGPDLIAHYDVDGIGFDNALAILPFPGKLGLADTTVAYVVMRENGDPNGSLLVSAGETSGGWSVNTTNGPVKLVLAGFGTLDDGTPPPQVDVEFELTTDSGFNVTGGGIDVQLVQPLNLEPYTGLPVELTAIRYTQDGGQFLLTGGGVISLPEALNNVVVDLEELTFDNTGLVQGTVEAGTFTTAFDPSIVPAISVPFEDYMTFNVMGARLAIGANNEAKLSGTVLTDLFKDGEDGPQTPIFYSAVYTNGSWAFGVDDNDAIQPLKLGVGDFEPEALGNSQGALSFEYDGEHFRARLSGIFSMKESLGDDFAVTIEDLRVGTDGFGVGDISTVQQQFDLFDGALAVGFQGMSADFDGSVFEMSLTQTNVTFADQVSVEVNNLTVASDGRFDLGGAGVNLVEQPLDIIEDVMTLTLLSVYMDDQGHVTLDAGAMVTLPDPIGATAEVIINISGEVPTSLEALPEYTFDIDGPNFVFGEGFEIGDNPATEIQLGDYATFDLTGAGIDLDLQDFTKTAIYATGAVYIENDVEKRLMFGQAADLVNNPGIHFEDGAFTWNLTSSATPDNPLFDFDVGFFRLTVHSVESVADNELGVILGGQAAMNVAGVGGFVTYEGFTISQSNFEQNNDWLADMGRLVPPVGFTVMDIVTLELGDFEFINAPNGETITIQEGNDPENLTNREVTVRNYLRFGTLEGPPAITISLTDLFVGSVQQVLFYEEMPEAGQTVGSIALYIKEAAMTINGADGAVSLGLNLKFITGPSGFELLAAGGGSFTSYGFAAAGKFALMDGQLSVGVFIAVSGIGIPLIPQAPPVVSLNGLGGGIFFRPTSEDLDFVYFALEQIGFVADAAPDNENMLFAILLYAEFGFLGQGGMYTIEGAGLITLTDQFLKLDLNGSVLSQGTSLLARGGITINWGSIEDLMAESGVQFVISGVIGLDVDYASQLTGTGEIRPQVSITLGNPVEVDWVINGTLEANFVGIESSGSMIISPAGFYADLNITAEVSAVVVTLSGEFNAQVALIPNDDLTDFSLMAYARVDVAADFFGTSISGTAEALFNKYNGLNFELYGMAAISVEVGGIAALAEMFIDEEITGAITVGAYFKIRNGLVAEAGIINEIDGVFANLIDEAKGLTNEMAAASAEAQAAVEAATSDYVISVDNEVVAAAGAAMQNLHAAGGFGFLINATMIANEGKLFPGPDNNPAGYGWVVQNVILAGNRPSDDAVDASYVSMTQAQSDVESASPSVIQGLGEMKAKAIEWNSEAATALEDLAGVTVRGSTTRTRTSAPPTRGPGESGGAPRESVGMRITETIPFEFDQEELSALESTVDAIDAAFSLPVQNERYRDAIVQVEANLMALEDLMDGKQGAGVSGLSSRYADAYSAIGEYYAKRTSYFHEMNVFANRVKAATEQSEPAIMNAIEASVSARKTLPSEECVTYQSWDCDDLALAIAENRISTFLESFGAVEVEASQWPAIREQMVQALQDGNDVSFDNQFRETGRQLWYEAHILGLGQIANEAMEAGQASTHDFQTKMGNLIEGHRSFTQSVDELYLIKAEMTTTLYGLVDIYVDWLERNQSNLAQDDRTASYYVESKKLRDRLALDLELPLITSITVDSDRLWEPVDQTGPLQVMTVREQYANRSRISWSATHPVAVVENSVSVIKAPLGPDQQTLQTVGAENQLVHWAFRGSGGEPAPPSSTSNKNPQTPSTGIYEEQSFNVAVRARGKAGYAITSTGQFSPEVDGPDEFVIPALLGNGDDEEILTEDTSPPSSPVIQLNQFVDNGLVSWGSVDTHLDLTLSASDGQTGVSEFEVGVGTSQNVTNVVAWKPFIGNRSVQGSTTTTSGNITGLSLEEGRSYYVFARATNGQGLVSQQRVSDTIRLDLTPPTAPTAKSSDSGSDVTASQVPVPYSVVQSAPKWSSPMTQPTETPNAVPVEWNAASDPQSGISGYRYLVSTVGSISAGELAASDQMVETSLRKVKVEPSYLADRYLHVAAVNKAGGSSPVLSVRHRTRDLTPPGTPKIAGMSRPDGGRIYLTQIPSDAESGIEGYQFAIGTNPSQANLKMFAEKGPDWTEADLTGTQKDATPFYFTVPGDVMDQLAAVKVDKYYVFIRALNGAGKPGTPAVVGPLSTRDESAPIAGKMTLSVGKSSLNITQDGMSDPESGIALVSWEMTDPVTDEVIGSGLFFKPTTPPLTPVNQALSISLASVAGRYGAEVELSIQNGDGLRVTSRSTVIIDASAPKKVSPPQSIQVIAGNGNTITWKRPDSPYFDHVVIFSRKVGSKSWTRLGDPPGSITSYTDTKGTPDMEYALASVSVTGAQGALSAPVKPSTNSTKTAPVAGSGSK